MSTNAANSNAGDHDADADGRTQDHVESAGAFDVRNFIAALLGLYGVILVVWGLVSHTAEDAAKTGGLNANLWTGVGLLVVAAAFFAWARLAPIVVEVHETADGGKELEAAD